MFYKGKKEKKVETVINTVIKKLIDWANRIIIK